MNISENNIENFDLSNDVDNSNNDDLTKILNEDENLSYEKEQVKWSEFIEVTVMNFFNKYKIERLSVEDGNGNRAKLSRTKDCGIKIEYFSTLIV